MRKQKKTNKKYLERSILYENIIYSLFYHEWLTMSDDLFKTTEKKNYIDEITKADIYNIKKPIKLSDNIKSIINSDLGLLVVNRESKAIRIVPVNSDKIIKVVIYLQDPVPFIKNIIDFYKKNNVTIVYTTGLCFRGGKLEDCLYEAYLDMSKSENLTEIQMIEYLKSIQGVTKIFTIPIQI